MSVVYMSTPSLPLLRLLTAEPLHDLAPMRSAVRVYHLLHLCTSIECFIFAAVTASKIVGWAAETCALGRAK
jgi:hypothetical protein